MKNRLLKFFSIALLSTFTFSYLSSDLFASQNDLFQIEYDNNQPYELPRLPKVIIFKIVDEINEVETQSKLVQTCKGIKNRLYQTFTYDGISYHLTPAYISFYNSILMQNGRKMNRFILDFQLDTDEGRKNFVKTYMDPNLSLSFRYNSSGDVEQRVAFVWYRHFKNYTDKGTLPLKNKLSNSEESTILDLTELGTHKNPYLMREIGLIRDLEQLNYNSGFIALSPILCDLTRLKVLKLATNYPDFDNDLMHLKALPVQFGNLSCLEHLDLSGNELELLPKSFSKLSKLKVLNLAYNCFKEFPNVLLELPNLEDLSFSNVYNTDRVMILDEDHMLSIISYGADRNNIMPLPAEFGSKLKNLRKLDISGNFRPQLPQSFSEMEALEELHMVLMGCESFKPKEFPVSLKRLDISNNLFAEIPLEVLCLSNLRKLKVNRNSIPIGIPEEILENSKIKVKTHGSKVNVLPQLP